MKNFVPAILSTLCAASLAAGKPHEHGSAKLDVAIEPTRITLQLESPLDNLLGFERAPRTDAERRQADALVARLKAADGLFKIDPAAGCTPGAVELVSAALKLGQAAASEEGHADIDASFEFRCADATKAAFIASSLFDFKNMQRVQVQVVTPKGQFQRQLKRPAGRIELAR